MSIRAYLSFALGRSRIVTPRPRDRTLAQQLSGAFVLFARLVAGASVLTALAYGANWAWVTPDRERAQAAMTTESVAHTAVLDQETALRGYLLTRDERFLEPYVQGEAALARANDALTAYVGAGGGAARVALAMVRTRLAEEQWHETWATGVAKAGPGAVAPSLTDGKALFDNYRRERAHLAEELQERSESLSRREQRTITARVALEMAAFLAILVLALQQHHALRNGIVAPVAALLRHIRRIRDGQMEATTDPAAPRELAELAEGLNEVVRALAAARAFAESRDTALREHSARLRQILDASREFSESLNLAYVVGSVRESTAAVGGYDLVIVWLMDDSHKRLVNADATVANPPTELRRSTGTGLAARAAKSGRITFEGPGGQVRFSDSNGGPVRAIAIPLIVGARVVGALEARHDESRVATLETIEILEMLATHAATAIESARLHEVIEERSQMDALTHLGNRRRLEEDLDAECKRCTRYDRPLAFVMLDVDHFKAFNDAHGHPRADVILQELAEVIAGCVRTTDTAYRYGGEEFCILLRETTAVDGMILAERLRQRIEARFESGATPKVTASFGVAEFSAATPAPRALIEAADAAMYESKHAGRNRVMLSSTPPPFAAPVLSS
jgi:diguanylate cyclase (GGDEF)-like protein